MHRAEGREHGLGAHLVVGGARAAGTGQAAWFLARLGKLKQLTQGGGSCPVQSGAHRHLGRFQIEAPCLPSLLENHPQELIYLASSSKGNIVLALYCGAPDPDTGGSFTVKKYSSVKSPEIGRRQTRIILSPVNPDFQAIEIPEKQIENFKIVAGFLAVVGK